MLLGASEHQGKDSLTVKLVCASQNARQAHSHSRTVADDGAPSAQQPAQWLAVLLREGFVPVLALVSLAGLQQGI